MIKLTMKKAMRRILNRFNMGRSASPSINPFTIQSQLIKVKEPVIFDIGAHVGAVSRSYRRRFPLAFIHSFEPFPSSFQSLSNSVKGDPRIFCHQKAVSNAVGTSTFNKNLNSETNSLLNTDDRGSSFWGEGLLDTTSQIEVNTTTIDTICTESDISNIDILKIDVQGAEYSVFEGAKSMLEDQKISLIYTELIMCPTYEGQHEFHEYLSFLASFGYEFLDFYNPKRNHNQLIQADVVFLSSSFKSKMQKNLKNI